MNRHFLVGGVVLLTLVVCAVVLGGDAGVLFDAPSLIWVLGILVGGLWMSFGPWRALRAISGALGSLRTQDETQRAERLAVLKHAYQMCWAGGLIGFLLGLMFMFNDLSDPAKIGSGVAVSMLTVVYGAVLAEFFFRPLISAVEASPSEEQSKESQPASASSSMHAIRTASILVVVCTAAATLTTAVSFAEIKQEDKYQAIVEEIQRAFDLDSTRQTPQSPAPLPLSHPVGQDAP